MRGSSVWFGACYDTANYNQDLMPRSAEHAPCAVTYHGKLADSWEDRYRRSGFQSRIRVLRESLQGADLERRRWLDAGCGSGTLARHLAARGAHVLGLDASQEMVNNANLASRGAAYPNLEFRHVGSIADLPLASRTFDGILCSSVLEYVPDVGACLAEFARVLRSGGYLLISVPNRVSIVRRAQIRTHHLARVFGRKLFPFLDYSRHEFTQFAFRQLLGQFGFTTSKVIPFGSPIPQWLQRREIAGSLLMFSAVRRDTV
jgi:2-polyprenyl-3-methyl-5-hydroxy-6-metoxy-1,4-benzoquinol methylase